MSALRPNQIRILTHLAQAGAWTSGRDLKTNGHEMSLLYQLGLVTGAGSQGARGWGMTPDTSWWQITMKGRETLYQDTYGDAPQPPTPPFPMIHK